MNRSTPSSFVSKGSIAGLETNVTYTQKNNELAMLQKSPLSDFGNIANSLFF